MRTVARRAEPRLVGLDLARFLALLGMMATHLLETRDTVGDPTWVAEVLSGRASALFAFLAGVSLALMTGGPRPLRGGDRVSRTVGLLVRALAIGVLGLALGAADSGLAIILVHYAVLFALGVLLVGRSARSLALLAAAWAVLSPVALWWLRPHLPPRGFDSPSPDGLERPWQLVSEVLLTGYYPVLVWMTYLLAGMALGRLDLRALRRRSLGLLAAGGATAAWSAAAVSDRLLAREGMVRLLDRDLWRWARRDDAEALELLHRQIDAGMFGQTPVEGAWQWLLVAAPHSSTGFDLVRTGGSALAVTAVCLLALRVLGPGSARLVAVLSGAGTATLSLYTLHVLMTSDLLPPGEDARGTALQYAIVVVTGAVLVVAGRRGPLEALVALAARGAERAVRGPAV